MKIEPCISQAFLKCSEAKFAKEVFHFNRHTKQFVNLVYELVIEMEHPPFSLTAIAIYTSLLSNMLWQILVGSGIVNPLQYISSPFLFYLFFNLLCICTCSLHSGALSFQAENIRAEKVCGSLPALLLTFYALTNYTQAGKRSDI